MPALPQLYPYKAGPIEPIVMPGEMVGLWISNLWEFYRVIYIETLPESSPLVIDLGAIAAGATIASVQLIILEQPVREFGQYRCRVLDDFSLLLWQGRADLRHRLGTTVAEVTKFTSFRNPDGHDTEFFVYYNQNDAFASAINRTSYPIQNSRVSFWGNRYIMEEVTVKNPQLGTYENKYHWPDKTPDVWTRVPATAMQ